VIIRADLDASRVTLVDPDDFRAFHIAVSGGGADDDRLGALLARHGRLDGDHAWITVDAVVALAGRPDDDEWRAGLDGMVAYAREKGFWDEASDAIRAHIEAT
jgi:hypothetical protein